MLKGKFVLLTLIAAALVSWQVSVSVDSANSGIVDPCSSSASSASGCYVFDPAGGTGLPSPLLSDNGLTISCTVKDNTGTAIAGIPAADFWLVGCTGTLVLCGGSGSINADAASDVSGNATISGNLRAGVLCDDDIAEGGNGTGSPETGLLAVAQGVVLGGPACGGSCLAITPRSPDINGDLAVDVIDFSLFGANYTSPPKIFDACKDFNCDGAIDIIDFSLFALSYLVAC